MYDPEQITFFAKTDARGQQVPFGIKAKDRTKHVYVIGKTGMGKSTLLENMAVQDIKNGNGIAFIDPHGATAETLLDYIPEERKDDVLYFAPFDTDCPISFNVMEDVGEDKRHLVVAGLMSVFKKIWVDAWSSRMEYILSNTLAALLEFPDATLLGVNRMLSDKHYRKKVVSNITDPAVKSFWVDEFANYNERYMQEAGDAIKNKIGQFTSNPLIRNIIGQPHSSFDIRELMDNRKILIANLSKGLVGESNANLLGSMLTTRIYLAAMSRADLSNEQLKQMPNYYFYVDEFQSFANATFADILSEARKYKLNLTIAHQYIEQMEEEVRNAVFGNVGTIISFRVGPFDAEILETIFTPKFLAADIVNLGFAQIYLTLMIDGIGSQPFSAVTLPPIEPPQTSAKQVVIAHSRKQFAKDRPSVEKRVNDWHAQSYDEKKLEYEARKKAEAANGGPTNGSHHDNKSGGNNNDQRQANGNGNGNTNTNQRSNHQNGGRNNNHRSDRGGTRDSNNQDRPAHANHTNHNASTGQQKPNQSNRRESGQTAGKPSGGSGRNGKPAEGKESVEELRNILRNLVASTDKKSSSNTPAKAESSSLSSKTNERRTSDTSPEVKKELQAALASVQGKGSSAPAAPKQSRQKQSSTSGATESKQHAGSTDQSSARSSQSAPPARHNESKPQSSATPAQKPQSQDYLAAKNHDDPLAPKKLERMMRVTGSDQSPFK